MNNPSIQFGGGVDSIGGNKIIVKSSNGYGILLDFGYNFHFSNTFYDSFLKERPKQILLDGFSMGFLPESTGLFKGIYKTEIIKKEQEELSKIINIRTLSEDSCIVTELAVSHFHGDHVGLIKYLRDDIQLIFGEGNDLFLTYFNNTTNSSSMFNGIYNPSSKTEKRLKPIYLKSTESRLVAKGGLELQYFQTDHSMPAAGAYLIKDIETGKKIVYTGDIRKHGFQKKRVEEFVKQAREFQPDVLLIEGTQIYKTEENERIEDVSELDVMIKIKKFIQNCDKKDEKRSIFFSTSPRNVQRFVAFYSAATSVNRKLVVDGKTYYLLKLFIESPYYKNLRVDFDNIFCFLPKKGSGTYINKDYSNKKDIAILIEDPNAEGKSKSSRFNLSKKFLIKAEDIRKSPEKYVIYMPFYQFNNLIDINPEPGSYYIESNSEPFNDEMEIQEEKKQNWLNLFGIDKKHQIHSHCSGHLYPQDVEWMINEIKPKKVFPIHTEHAELFSTMLKIDPSITIMKTEKGKEFFI